MEAIGGPEAQDLAKRLKALANPVRLRLLHQLRAPLRLADIRIVVEDANTGRARPIARQSIQEHLGHLIDAGLVLKLQGRAFGTTPHYVVNHTTAYEILERLRETTSFTPEVQAEQVTRAALPTEPVPESAEEAPAFVLVKGLAEGRRFPVPRGAPTDGGFWIGRDRGSAVCLDYDPFVSARHCVVTIRHDAVYLEDPGESRNGTSVGYVRIEPGVPQRLRHGDVITIGRSTLVFTAGGNPASTSAAMNDDTSA